MARKPERTRWVSYLRVSTAEQAERELSLTAQRRAIADFAARHGAVIDHEYVEPGASGTDPNRAVLRLLGTSGRDGSPCSRCPRASGVALATGTHMTEAGFVFNAS